MPMFETDEDRTYFLTTLFIHPEFEAEEEIFKTSENEVLNEVLNEALSDDEKTILRYFYENPKAKQKDAIEELSLSKRKIQESMSISITQCTLHAF